MEDTRRTYIRTLETVLALHRELLAALERESEAMVKHDLATIEKTVRQEEALAENMRLAEEKRVKALARLGRELNMELGRANLAEVADACGGAWREPLMRLRAELRATSEEVARKNRLKALLCEQSLAHVKGMLKMLTGAGGTGLYNAGGCVETGTRQVILDQRV